MPLLLIRQINAHTLLGLWEVAESPAQLHQELHGLAPLLPLPAFARLQRQQEWLAARLLAYTLLRQMTPAYHPLTADAFGKPKFEGCPFHLSLSHSAGLVAVILSQTHEVGIDLELIHPKIKALAPRFLNEPELLLAADDPEKLGLLWSAKETLYKLYGKKKLDFREHLQVEVSPLAEPGELAGRLISPGATDHYLVRHERIGQHVLTYCLA